MYVTISYEMTDGACLPGDTTIAMTISGNNHNVSGGNVVYGDSIENHIKNENQIKILGTCLSHVKIAATPPVSDTISSTISPTYLLDYFERCTWCAIALPFLVCYCLVISIISLPIILIVVMIRIPVRIMSKCCKIKSHGFTRFLLYITKVLLIILLLPMAIFNRFYQIGGGIFHGKIFVYIGGKAASLTISSKTVAIPMMVLVVLGLLSVTAVGIVKGR